MTNYQARLLLALIMDKDESTSTLRYMMYVLDENLLPSKDRSKSQKNAMSSFLREWADALEDV